MSDQPWPSSEKAWHRAYSRWYDHREAGHPRRAAVWGWLADRICRQLPTNLTAGVNDGPGSSFPDGADDAPNKSKDAAVSATASRPAPAVNPVDLALRLHETFRAYVAAEGAATRAFIGYQCGEVPEVEVHRLQCAERAATRAHIEAMNAATGLRNA